MSLVVRFYSFISFCWIHSKNKLTKREACSNCLESDVVIREISQRKIQWIDFLFLYFLLKKIQLRTRTEKRRFKKKNKIGENKLWCSISQTDDQIRGEKATYIAIVTIKSSVVYMYIFFFVDIVQNRITRKRKCFQELFDKDDSDRGRTRKSRTITFSVGSYLLIHSST